MDFQLAPEELAFREELKVFLKQELPPDWTGEEYEEEEGGDESWQFTLRMRKKLADKGWLTLAWPKEHGGGGASIMTQLVFNEEMAYHRAPGVDMWGVKMLAPTLMIHGTDEQKQRFLPSVAKGEVQWCQGYSEPESGSDLASLQTKAVVDGDDYIINGTKIWTSNAHRADWIILLARTDQDAPKHRGITMLLLDMKTPGVEIRPIINMAGVHGFNQIFFDNVRVPKRNLVGEENRGWYVGATLLDFERSGVNYSASARRSLEELVEFAKETKTNGRTLSKDTARASASCASTNATAPTGSTPTTRISGAIALAAVATPEIRPPPPIATTSTSMPGDCLSISRPTVPWPAMTAGSAKGWM
ncbi:MAG: acyl-CoA dehydrogenase family protein [Chloroflexi bacterium]|nr:acyl-CoA dehydrogenase family protein [Chloroflexota bacterium]